MPITPRPASFRIVELRLSGGLAGESPRRQLNKSRNPHMPLAEVWRGQIVFAPVSRAVAAAQHAALEALDGKVTAFGVVLKQGFATHANAFAGTLASAAAPGADAISVQSGTPTDVEAGTLLAVGTAGDANYQVVEVLQAASVGAATLVYIAPRIRNAIAGGTSVTGGDITIALRTSKDELDARFDTDRGALPIDVIEAI